ncbi:MAG: cation:proton antiporter [Dehalococcoidia bacterium]|nr:cation:proton antiporter [Dehalococcoidia bacterium]
MLGSDGETGAARVAVEYALQLVAVIAVASAVAQVTGRRTFIPVPVFLLVVGMVLGEDGVGWIAPSRTAELSRLIVVLSVAIIVFEGSTSLRWQFLGVVASPVRNLVVLGLIITPVVGAVSVHAMLGTGWRVSFLFGALVAVTGPSVISPLLRSIRVNDRLRATLMGEGIIIDPFGALLTLFLLQLAVAGSFEPTGPARWVITRVVAGALIGGGGALAVFVTLRVVQRLLSREVGLLVLGGAVAVFALAERFAPESGLTAMVVMGIALANVPVPHREAVDELMETLSAVLVGSVYLILAASVDMSALRGLWPEGLIVVGALVVIGRPLLVFLATIRSRLSIRERLFLAAVAPRGVVAASLASVVAVEAGAHLGADEARLVALVFAVILTTITVQSLYAGPLSRLLRVYPMTTVIAGAGEVGRRLATRLLASGEEVTLIEASETAAMQAREAGFTVILGEAGKIEVLRAAGLDHANGLVLTTADDEKNLLAAQLARTEFQCQRILARVNERSNMPAFASLGVTVVNPSEATAMELAAAFGEPDLSESVLPWEEDVAAVRVLVSNPDAQRQIQQLGALRGTVVPIIRRGARNIIPDGRTTLQVGDVLTVFGRAPDIARVRRALTYEG